MTLEDASGRAERENEGNHARVACDASGGVLSVPAAPAAYV
jgi:hypothetical protein